VNPQVVNLDATGVANMSAITEDRIQRIEGRVTAVEQAQNDNTQSLRFIVATVAQMKAVQDDHGHVFEEHSRQLGELRTDVNGLRTEVGGLRTDLQGLRKELPTIVADVMREVLREKR
jgi:DNA-binding FrmR family transcriptional regulator